MCKKALCLIFAFLFSIESMAAVVSDNDGAAFVTKAEFEVLKENFEAQINNYNESLDNKIDGAIASYLSGIKLDRWEPIKLDGKSQYKFPLVMCGPNNEWNNPNYKSDTGLHYFDVMIPQFDYWSSETKYARNSGGDSTGARQGFFKPYNQMPSALPSYEHDENEKIVRVSRTLDERSYSGAFGTLNLVSKSTETKLINGVSHSIFDLGLRGKGKLLAFIRSNGMGNYWDGVAEYTPDATNKGKWFNYPLFIGLDPSNFTIEGEPAVTKWNVPVGTKPTVNPWTRDGVFSRRAINSNVKNGATRTDLTNIKDALDYYTSDLFVKLPYTAGLYENGSGNKWANPYLVLPEWDNTEGTNTCYFGTGMMQANLNKQGGYWSLTPIQGTSADTQKIDKVIISDQSKNCVSIFNFSQTLSYSTFSPYIPNEIWLVPYWVATENSSFAQDSTDHFSAIRASIVRYYDSNGDAHFLDEGMYLGTSEKREAKVKFKIRFADDSNWAVDVALSKKPFSYDAISSDQMSFTWNEEGNTTKNVVAAGGVARLSCNKTYDIEFEGIEMGDKMYMKWTPATTGHYVALESFSDFYISGT